MKSALIILLATVISATAGFNDWTPQQQSDFSELVATAPMQSSPKIAKWCNVRAITGYTYTTNSFDRAAYEQNLRKAFRKVVTDCAITDLSSAGHCAAQIKTYVQGLATVNAKTDYLAIYTPNFWKAYGDFKAINLTVQDDEAYERVTATPIKALSRAQLMGIDEIVTSRDVEAAQ